MGYFKDNTVEVEINGQKVRVFKQEAEALKAKLAKSNKKAPKEEK